MDQQQDNQPGMAYEERASSSWSTTSSEALAAIQRRRQRRRRRGHLDAEEAEDDEDDLVEGTGQWYPSGLSFPPAAPTPPGAPRTSGSATTSRPSASDQNQPGENVRWAALIGRLRIPSPQQRQLAGVAGASLSAVHPDSDETESESEAENETISPSGDWRALDKLARAYDDLQASGLAPGDGSMFEDITNDVLRSKRSDRSDRSDRSGCSGRREMESRSTSTHDHLQSPPRSAVAPGSSTEAEASSATSTLTSRDGVFLNENRAIPVHPARYLVKQGRNPTDATAEDVLDIYTDQIAENDDGIFGSN